MAEVNLKFTSSPTLDIGSFRLLELPPDLCKLIESAIDSTTPNWVIKGQANDDAVLCTAEKTYTLRSVVLSNSVLVVTPPNTDSEGDPGENVVIRDSLHEVLELVPCVPKLQKLGGLLKGHEYDEGHDIDDDDEDMKSGSVNEDSRPAKRRRFTYEDAREMLQASDVELNRGLQDRRVLVLHGELRPIAPSHLTTILELLLNYSVSLSLPHQAAPVNELAAALEDEHEIKRKVSTQVMSWFGEVFEGKWKLDIQATVKEVGLGILRVYKDDPIPEDEFLTKWRSTVGDTFETHVSLDLLSGNYLEFPSPTSHPPVPVLAYFPSSALPVDPAARFTDLFLTRPRWKADEISPFLNDIVVNNKERDKLLLKYARATTDSEGVWYTARAKYNG